MKFDYELKYNKELVFSERQLQQMSGLHLIRWYLENLSLKDIPNINLKWIENHRYKRFDVLYDKELKKKGFYDTGRILVRKAKKGYVVEMKYKFRSKKMKVTPIRCYSCNSKLPINWHQYCEKCTKSLGGYDGIMKHYHQLQK